MDAVKIWIIIIGMGIVTYIPRALPAAFIDKMKFGKRVEKFLKLIPYTAMTSLIIPGVFTTDANNLSIGIVGGGVAALLAWFRCPVMVCVLGAIAADFVLYVFV